MFASKLVCSINDFHTIINPKKIEFVEARAFPLSFSFECRFTLIWLLSAILQNSEYFSCSATWNAQKQPEKTQTVVRTTQAQITNNAHNNK